MLRGRTFVATSSWDAQLSSSATKLLTLLLCVARFRFWHLPLLLGLSWNAVGNTMKHTMPGTQVVDHHLSKPVIHVHLKGENRGKKTKSSVINETTPLVAFFSWPPVYISIKQPQVSQALQTGEIWCSISCHEHHSIKSVPSSNYLLIIDESTDRQVVCEPFQQGCTLGTFQVDKHALSNNHRWQDPEREGWTENMLIEAPEIPTETSLCYALNKAKCKAMKWHTILGLPRHIHLAKISCVELCLVANAPCFCIKSLANKDVQSSGYKLVKMWLLQLLLHAI